jgi:hypothetical protein
LFSELDYEVETTRKRVIRNSILDYVANGLSV